MVLIIGWGIFEFKQIRQQLDDIKNQLNDMEARQKEGASDQPDQIVRQIEHAHDNRDRE
jgi:hypothetical protein